MNLRIFTILTAWLLVATHWREASAVVISIPMDQQINIGLGNAILPDGKTPAGLDRITFENDSGAGFTRFHLVEGNGMNGWYDGPIVNLVRAGIGPLDLSKPGSMLSFDARYYQAPEDYPPGTPWINHDAPIGVYVFSSDSAWREYGYPYHSIYGDPPYPAWTHIDLDPNAPSSPRIGVTDYGALDMSKIIGVAFFGTNWPGQGNDFIDVKSLGITAPAVPEPSAVAFVVLGFYGAMRSVRNRQTGLARI